MQDFRQYRKLEVGEFIVVGCDTCSGGGDYSVAQFLSKTKLDVPLVYHSKKTTSYMTDELLPVLENICNVTGVPPLLAYETNNGGIFELERLARLNKNNKFRIYTRRVDYDKLSAIKGKKYGWVTSSATRPAMLQDLKEAIDNVLLRVYDSITVNELFSFIVNQTASSWKAQAESGAHDDCFIAGTMILTDKGNVPVEDVRVGDMVMTRGGYKTVEVTRSSLKKVITRLGLTGSPDHPMITKRGIVDLKNIKGSDILYIWNEKQLSIEERSITDIQVLRGDSTGCITGDTISGRNRLSRFIDRFTLTRLVKFLKDISYTTKTETLLITNLKTSSVYQEQGMLNSICQHQKEGNFHQRTLKDSTISTGRRKLQTVRSVARSLLTPVCVVLGFAQTFVKVGIGQKERVYNIQVADHHEYFANNILVHNCIMALAIAWQLYQQEPSPAVINSGLINIIDHNKKVSKKWGL